MSSQGWGIQPHTVPPGTPHASLYQIPEHIVTLRQHLESLTDLSEEQKHLRHRYLTSLGSAVVSDPLLKAALAVALGNLDACSLPAAANKLAGDYWNQCAVLGHFIPSEILEPARIAYQRVLFESGFNANLADDYGSFCDTLNLMSERGFRFGLAQLDDALGTQPSELTLLAGDKGVGKTWLVLHAISETVRHDPESAVLFYSLDMAKVVVIKRLCALEGQAEQLPHDPPAWFRQVKVINRHLGRADSSSESDLGLLNEITQLRIATGAKRILVVVDLFQKLLVPNHVASTERDAFRLDAIDNTLAACRRNHGFGKTNFLVTSEIRKSGLSTQRRTLSFDDLKGDGRLASDASTVLLMSTDDTIDESRNTITINVAKGRDGVVRGPQRFVFDHRQGTFEASTAKAAKGRRKTVVAGAE